MAYKSNMAGELIKLYSGICIYVFCWFLTTWLLDPTVPYDAVEALNWATNGEWGSPKNPWLPGAVMLPLVFFDGIPVSLYWYAVHFIAVGTGMVGVWHLARDLNQEMRLSWFAVLSLGISGVINFDIIPYNDNYLLVMFWPWMFWLFLRALTRSPWWWLPFSAIAGLAVMTKYSSLGFLLFILLTPALFPSLRRPYVHPAFWGGCCLALL
ncbi:glycosyltransferase family 39 protein [Klebsiella aerogenes]|uniref:glycosyltransferase family 39 protein n=1 Tax=Klebsiella aerogenes TaxID=548 RepID=UPI002FF4821A